MGPELARPVDWRNQLPRVLAQLHYATVGIHAYPLSACRSTRAVTIGGLLSTKSADEPSRLAWVVGDARAAGAPAIISEANSASCGGLAGVSDAPASAVWAVRFVLEALKSGFEEVRFHSAGDPYDPFLVRGGAVLRRPLESALAALNTWLPAGSTFRTVPGVRNLVATAVAEPGGKLLLILDNEGAHAQPVVIRGAGGVNVEALSASIAGLQQLPTSRVHGVVRLSIAKDTVAALSPAG
jgi:hypothetical protein